MWYSHCLSTETSNLCVHRKHRHGPEASASAIYETRKRAPICVRRMSPDGVRKSSSGPNPLTQPFCEELEHITAAQYQELVRYYRRRSMAVEEIIGSRDLAALGWRAFKKQLAAAGILRQVRRLCGLVRRELFAGHLYVWLTSSICHKYPQFIPHLLLEPGVLAKLKAKTETLQLKAVSGEALQKSVVWSTQESHWISHEYVFYTFLHRMHTSKCMPKYRMLPCTHGPNIRCQAALLKTHAKAKTLPDVTNSHLPNKLSW
jgi:hypothetical protein